MVPEYFYYIKYNIKSDLKACIFIFNYACMSFLCQVFYVYGNSSDFSPMSLLLEFDETLFRTDANLFL